VLKDMDPGLVGASGALLASLVLLVVMFGLWRRARSAEKRLFVLQSETSRLREVLAACPDGLFVWDLVDGHETCSRRLAVMLGLAGGTQSSFFDVRDALDPEAGQSLTRAVERLRRDGGAFDLLLPARDRLIQAIGARAGTLDGQPVADLLWMRDVDAVSAAAQPAPAPAPGGGTEALAAAYESFQALLDSLPIPVWLRDGNLELAFGNRALGGAAAPALTGGDLAARARASGRPATEPRRLGDGASGRILDVTETPVKGWIGTAGFAMERPRAPGLPEDILEGLGTALAVFGADTRLLRANGACARLWDLDADWLRGQPTFAEVLDRARERRRLPEPADFKAFKDSLLGRFGQGEAFSDQWHLADGKTLRVVLTPRPDGGLVWAGEDVSERLALQRDLHTLEAVRRETLDNLHEGIAVFGGDGRLRLSNPAFRRIWKLGVEDLPPGSHVSEFVERTRPFITVSGPWEEHRARVVARIASREPDRGRLVRNDQSILDFANVPLPDGAVLLSYLDVTDSAQVEMALRERTLALDEAGRLKSAFIASVSHEIRTPMTTIIGFAETLTQEYFGKLNRRQLEYSQGILDASQGLMRVVGDILDLASIEAGMLRLELDTVDLHAMLVSVLGLVKERARRQDLKLEFDCPVDIGWIVADERRIKQVLFNLLSNALRFTPARGTVLLAARRGDTEVAILVADTGVGIPQADLDRVFGSFEKGAAQGGTEAPGAGLGLTIVKQFVELHGGRVEIRSTPGKGTTVTCHLPAGGLADDGPLFPPSGL
jgi:signal transduction histidine kinase